MRSTNFNYYFGFFSAQLFSQNLIRDLAGKDLESSEDTTKSTSKLRIKNNQIQSENEYQEFEKELSQQELLAVSFYFQNHKALALY